MIPPGRQTNRETGEKTDLVNTLSLREDAASTEGKRQRCTLCGKQTPLECAGHITDQAGKQTTAQKALEEGLRIQITTQTSI